MRCVILILALVLALLLADSVRAQETPSVSPPRSQGARSAEETTACLARLNREWEGASRARRRELLNEIGYRVGLVRDSYGYVVPPEELPKGWTMLGERIGCTPAERQQLGGWLRNALRKSPKDPELNVFLGTALWGGFVELRIVAHTAVSEVRAGYLANHRSRSMIAYLPADSQLEGELFRAMKPSLEQRRLNRREIAAILLRLPCPVFSDGYGEALWDLLRQQDRFQDDYVISSPDLRRGMDEGPQRFTFERAFDSVEKPKVAQRALVAIRTRGQSLKFRVPMAYGTEQMRKELLPREIGFIEAMLRSGGRFHVSLNRPLVAGESIEALQIRPGPMERASDLLRESVVRFAGTRLGTHRKAPRWLSMHPFVLADSYRVRDEASFDLVSISDANWLRTKGDELLVEPAFRLSNKPTPFGTLFVEHACVGDTPATWEVSLNGGRPLRFIAQPCPRPARMKLPKGLLKPNGNELRFRRISGGAILLDGIGLEP